MQEQTYLIVVVGPTAVGKTDLCVRLANHLKTEVVSADSRQFYREMNIGTAKPTTEEQQGIVHHFIDSHSIVEDYNAVAFENDALACINSIFQTHQTCLLTGGSTLYIKTITDGMDDIPDVDPEIRVSLQQMLENEGLAALLARLDTLDPTYAQQVDRANPQRVLRALEVCIGTGLPYSSFRTGAKVQRSFRMIKIGLNRDREELYQRINRRMDEMLKNGLVEEVKHLLPYKDKNALQTVGYREVFDYLDGLYDEAEMVRLLKRNSRRYAKRQLTWFQRDPEYHWFHPDQYEEIVALIEQQLGQKS
jgi:tRNA dimethylallyltransferase